VVPILGAFVDTGFRTSVGPVLDRGDEHLIGPRHTFERQGIPREYQSVNVCSLAGYRLRTWSSSPLSLSQYAEAWGLRIDAPPAPVFSDGVRTRFL
jgi:hypothetical protein